MILDLNMDKEQLIALVNQKSGGFNRHNGVRIVDFTEDCVTVEAEITPEAQNPMGMAHGGFVYTLCDVAAGVALRLGGRTGVTLSSNMYFLHRSEGNFLRCEAKIVKPGSKVVVLDTCVYDNAGEMTARGIFEVYIVMEESPEEAVRNSR